MVETARLVIHTVCRPAVIPSCDDGGARPEMYPFETRALITMHNEVLRN